MSDRDIQTITMNERTKKQHPMHAHNRRHGRKLWYKFRTVTSSNFFLFLVKCLHHFFFISCSARTSDSIHTTQSIALIYIYINMCILRFRWVLYIHPVACVFLLRDETRFVMFNYNVKSFILNFLSGKLIRIQVACDSTEWKQQIRRKLPIIYM